MHSNTWLCLRRVRATGRAQIRQPATGSPIGIKREDHMSVESLRSRTSVEPGAKSVADFQITLLVSVLGLTASLLVLPLLGVDLGVLALAG